MIDLRAIPIGDLVPHGPEMTVIDRILTYSPERTVAAVEITRRSLFFAGTGVPAWVGIEYMAQTIGLYAGIHARRAGEPIRLGFLLGSRRYESNVPGFPFGAVLTVRAEKVMQDERLSVFNCVIEGGHVKVSAVLNVYQAPIDTIKKDDE